MNTPTPTSKLKKGEYVRFKDSDTAPVWQYTHKADGRFYFSRCDDFNREISKAPSTIVFIGFDY